MKTKAFVFLLALALFPPLPAHGATTASPDKPHQGESAHSMAPGDKSSPEGPSSTHQHPTEEGLSEEVRAYVELEEKLGQEVPLDTVFLDEKGEKVTLEELVTRPTVVALVYYNCKDVCPLLLHGVAEVVDRIEADPLKDYQVLTVSFDETDTPELAGEKKKNFLASLNKPFPTDAWRFLTGDPENIKKLTEAVGFRFKRQGDIFLHPVSLVVLSPKGKVIRYLYGTTFLPFDLKMALVEASEGRFGPTITKVLRYCFTYDPKGRKYVFNILRVTGTSMVLVVLAMLIVLRTKGKGQTRKEG
jgi:protein SCO1/2